MELILVLLAILGGAALIYRFIRSLLRAVLATAEATAASGLAEVSARRGDLSLLAERRQVQQGARRTVYRHAIMALLWLLLLILPLYLGWTLQVYALAALAWLLPVPAIRASPGGPPT